MLLLTVITEHKKKATYMTTQEEAVYLPRTGNKQ